MILRQEDTAGERPFNNLLRRLNDADFALIEPHLVPADAASNDLLYSPGDPVETVHFPCGPSLVSYMVTNEDGRDVETILIGREGAVGGIVSQGYLPAYTRISVKFAGPFVRLPIAKLDAAIVPIDPTTGGHPFYRRLNQVLDTHNFDDFVEAQCASFYDATVGRPSLTPGTAWAFARAAYTAGYRTTR